MVKKDYAPKHTNIKHIEGNWRMSGKGQRRLQNTGIGNKLLLLIIIIVIVMIIMLIIIIVHNSSNNNINDNHNNDDN